MTHPIAARLDRATLDHRLLEHTFYKAWTAGRLTQEDLSLYSCQYWRQVEAFPGYLQTLATRTSGRVESILRDNLEDEVGGDHPALWLQFAEAVGVPADAVRSSEVCPETHSCTEQFSQAAQDAPIPFALGMLYGYESQTPEVATVKVDGLRSLYGIDGDGVRYFELHGELDVDHTRELASAIAQVCTGDEPIALAERGAAAGAAAIYTLLDGVARERNITC